MSFNVLDIKLEEILRIDREEEILISPPYWGQFTQWLRTSSKKDMEVLARWKLHKTLNGVEWSVKEAKAGQLVALFCNQPWYGR